jgi:CPA1 family monovalent cation:H+ antiporter
MGLSVPFLYCLLFGALISPTDPVAVLGLVKTAGAPKTLETKIAGESVFNDGVGVVVFLILLAVAKGGHAVTPGAMVELFLVEAGGGAALGLASGAVAYQLLKRVDNYQVELLLTLAMVMGGYALADAIHTSGPIVMVTAGLFIGNHGRAFAMSETTRAHLDAFWELVDEILNAVLLVLIGLEVLVMPFTPRYLLAGLIAIPVVLLARGISVWGTVNLLRWRRTFTPGAVRIITWCGLRGGISVAFALSLPAGPERAPILAVTYAVVVFSIVVQGLTVPAVVRRTLAKE